jgi:uncharacterized alkaline shock family protein YloU
MTGSHRPGTPPASSAGAVIDGINVDDVAAAVQACPGVSGLDGGRFGEVASYLPGRRVQGVAVRTYSVTVQVRSRWGVSAPDLLSQITAALTPLIGVRRVEVVVADIDEPPALEGSLPSALEADGLPGPVSEPSAPI